MFYYFTWRSSVYLPANQIILDEVLFCLFIEFSLYFFLAERVSDTKQLSLILSIPRQSSISIVVLLIANFGRHVSLARSDLYTK
jgi:hypothetical protein